MSILMAYHTYLDVFSKKGAEILPPHRPYNFPIELRPGAEIPFGPIFPLYESKLATLKQYVHDNLKRYFIRPSTSPAIAQVYYLWKIRIIHCGDYRELNKISQKSISIAFN